MKKIIITFLFIITFIFVVKAVLAVNPREIRKENREEIREGKIEGLSPAQIRKEIREEAREKGKNLRFAARISGTIASISGNVLTLTTNDGKTYTVNITSETKLKRKFWGNATLVEFAVGHSVNVVGKWTDETKITIDARVIRDSSIQKRWGAFFGKVTAKNSNNFVIETISRGSQTVYFGSTTKFFKINMEAMTYDELLVGNRVRVKGVWDNLQNKIIEVEQVKDFSLGIIKTATPTVKPRE